MGEKRITYDVQLQIPYDKFDCYIYLKCTNKLNSKKLGQGNSLAAQCPPVKCEVMIEPKYQKRSLPCSLPFLSLLQFQPGILTQAHTTTVRARSPRNLHAVDTNHQTPSLPLPASQDNRHFLLNAPLSLTYRTPQLRNVTA